MQRRNRETQPHFHYHDDVSALNLGLDVMEMLLADGAPPTLEAMASRLNSPVQDVEHVVDFLETRGYLVRIQPDAPHQNVIDLDELRILTPAMRELVRRATPVMQQASDDIGQSCNLSVPLGQHLLVIAQIQPATVFYINVALGFKYEIARTAPGLLWSAGQDAGCASASFTQAANPVLEGVTDISCLVGGESGPVAVLTVPYLRTIDSADMAACASELMQAATAISDALVGSRLVA